jgi:hypothetical protein
LKTGRDYLDYIQDILAMMEKIESFTAGMTQEEEFPEDGMHNTSEEGLSKVVCEGDAEAGSVLCKKKNQFS